VQITARRLTEVVGQPTAVVGLPKRRPTWQGPGRLDATLVVDKLSLSSNKRPAGRPLWLMQLNAGRRPEGNALRQQGPQGPVVAGSRMTAAGKRLTLWDWRSSAGYTKRESTCFSAAARDLPINRAALRLRCTPPHGHGDPSGESPRHGLATEVSLGAQELWEITACGLSRPRNPQVLQRSAAHNWGDAGLAVPALDFWRRKGEEREPLYGACTMRQRSKDPLNAPAMRPAESN